MEQKYKGFYDKLKEFDIDLERLKYRKDEEEKIIIPLIEDFRAKLMKIPRYDSKSGLFDISNTCLSLNNEDAFKIFIFIENENIHLDEIDYLIGQMKLNRLGSREDIDRLLIVMDFIKKKGNYVDIKEDFYKLGLSSEMLCHEVGGALGFLHSLLMFKNRVNLLMQRFLCGAKTMKEYKNDSNSAYRKMFSIYIDLLDKYVNDTIKYNRYVLGLIDSRNKLVKLLDNGNIEDIVEVDDSFYNLDDLFLEYLKIVNDNIKRKHAETVLELGSIESEYENTYIKRFLFENGIDYKSVNASIINRLNTLDEKHLERVINLFAFIDIDLYRIFNDYYRLFYDLDSNMLDVLEELISKHVVTPSTLRKHLGELDRKVYLMNTNYTILKGNINFENEYYSDELLFQDSYLLKTNILILGMYNISNDLLIYLMSHTDKIDILDKMLEKGIPKYLFMSIVNSYNPELVISKIIIASELGMVYSNEEMQLDKSIVVADRFKIPDSIVGEYLVNDNIVTSKGVSLKSDNIDWDLVKAVDSLYRRNDIYVINGIRISRAKFIRNISNGDDLYNALIRGSILSASELHIINGLLKQEKGISCLKK